MSLFLLKVSFSETKKLTLSNLYSSGWKFYIHCFNRNNWLCEFDDKKAYYPSINRQESYINVIGFKWITVIVWQLKKLFRLCLNCGLWYNWSQNWNFGASNFWFSISTITRSKITVWWIHLKNNIMKLFFNILVKREGSISCL